MLKIIGDSWVFGYNYIQPTKDVTIYFEKKPVNPNPETDIFIQIEPEAITPLKEYMLQNHKKFKYILTYNNEVLDSCSNAKLYVYGTSWISKDDYLSVNVNKKQFKISTIIGHKMSTEGHRLRRTILDNETIFRPIDFFVSDSRIKHGKPLVGSSKFKTFEEYQYQIVIENSRQVNYFTEKIVDCLITRTIPIYWGCPNISDFFDTTGWIVFDSIQDLKDKLESLTSDNYSNHNTVIETNYEKAIYYCNFGENINKCLKRISDY